MTPTHSLVRGFAACPGGRRPRREPIRARVAELIGTGCNRAEIVRRLDAPPQDVRDAIERLERVGALAARYDKMATKEGDRRQQRPAAEVTDLADLQAKRGSMR